MNLTALKDNWPAVVLITVGLVCFTLTAIFAPPDVRELLFGTEGLLGMALGIWLRSPREHADRRRSRASTPVPAPAIAPSDERAPK